MGIDVATGGTPALPVPVREGASVAAGAGDQAASAATIREVVRRALSGAAANFRHDQLI
jgi:hypothetical protein